MNHAVVAIISWTESEQIMIGSRVTYGAYEGHEFGRETFTYQTKRTCSGFLMYEDIFLMREDPSRFFTYHTITTITSSCPFITFISREEIYTAQVDKTRQQNDRNVQPLRVSPMW
jgi:hypothetical protein